MAEYCNGNKLPPVRIASSFNIVVPSIDPPPTGQVIVREDKIEVVREGHEREQGSAGGRSGGKGGGGGGLIGSGTVNVGEPETVKE